MGTGGNHLANLISLNTEFSPRFDCKDYHVSMIEKYQHDLKNPRDYGDTIAHFTKFQNLQKDTWDEHKNNINNPEKRNVFCSHIDEYVFSTKIGVARDLPDKIFILMDYPSNGTVAYKRHRAEQWYRQSPIEYTKEAFIEFLIKHSHVPPNLDELIVIDSSQFMSHSGFEYITSTLNEKIGLEIPEIGRKMHTLWINAIESVTPHT